jgi:hypothetical protein
VVKENDMTIKEYNGGMTQDEVARHNASVVAGFMPEAAEYSEVMEVEDAMIDSLSLRSRAYQVLYALGADPSTVRTLTTGEASCLVGIVQDIGFAQRPPTTLEQVLVDGMSVAMMWYVATGEMITPQSSCTDGLMFV